MFTSSVTELGCEIEQDFAVLYKDAEMFFTQMSTDDCAGWCAVDKFLYVCHAGTGNAENAQDAVLRITAEFWGED